MEIDFGKEIVSCENSLEEWLSYMKNHLTYDEREVIFKEARRDGKAHFSPKLGLHLMLKRSNDGTYTLERA